MKISLMLKRILNRRKGLHHMHMCDEADNNMLYKLARHTSAGDGIIMKEDYHLSVLSMGIVWHYHKSMNHLCGAVDQLSFNFGVYAPNLIEELACKDCLDAMLLLTIHE